MDARRSAGSIGLSRDAFDKTADPNAVVEESEASKAELPFSKMLTYSSIKFMMSLYDFTIRPARFGTYIEAFGMPPSLQAVLIAIAQSIALVLGVIIGKWSDDTRTRWGRRRPFIAIAFPIGTLCMLLFCTPTLTPFFQQVEIETPPCTDYFGADGDCGLLETCLQTTFNVTNNQPTEEVIPDRVARGLFLVTVWFVVFYTGFYTLVWTSTSIPYDALGMELTDDSERRLTMFAVRGFVQIVGYAVPSVMLIFLNSSYADNVPYQYAFMAMTYTVVGLLAVSWLLCSIKEKPLVEKPADKVVPLVPQIRRVLQNKPYIRYLRLRLPQQIVSLLPPNIQLFYIKFVMGREAYIGLNSQANILAILGILVGMPIMFRFAKKVGRGMALFYVNGAMCVLFAITFFVPGTWMDANEWGLYVLCFCVGCSWAAFYMIPDGMLADTIDYDELRTGERSEAMYTVVETQLALFVEIFGGVLPLILLELIGFINNGGCDCGCGVSCASLGVPYARWICPSDVAFNCDGQIGTDPFFGVSDRRAPCAVQTSLVMWGIKFFYVGLTGICGIFVMIPAYGWDLSPQVMQQVQSEIKKRRADPEYKCTDPLTGKKITVPENNENEFFAEHFSPAERRAAASGGGDMVTKLRGMVTNQLTCTVGAFVVALVACLVVNEYGVWSVMIILLTAISSYSVWHYIRLGALKTPPAGMSESLMQPAESVTEMTS